MNISKTWDAVVIGAGPCGALLAALLAKKKQRVLLLDKAAFPRHKVCGCCLSQHALHSLESAGFQDLLRKLPRNELKEFCAASSGTFLSLEMKGGLSVSRTLFDFELVQEAQKSGAVFLSQTPARVGKVIETVREVFLGSENFKIHSNLVFICDGLAGTALGEQEKSTIKEHSRYGISSIIPDQSDFFKAGTIYMACGAQGYAGIVKLEDGRLNIAAALDFSLKSKDFSSLIAGIFTHAGFPQPEQLQSAVWHGTPRLTRARRKIAGERYFVLGDAAGYTEPFTGEGMTWAIDSAIYLAELLGEKNGDWDPSLMEAWQKWHKKKIKTKQQRSFLFTKILRMPVLVKVFIKFLAPRPFLAQPIINALCGVNHA